MEFPNERLRIELTRFTQTVQWFALLLQPDGGQGVARRNAWRGLSEDRRRREQRCEAERSVEVALLAQRPVSQRPVSQRPVDAYLPEQYSPGRLPAAAAV